MAEIASLEMRHYQDIDVGEIRFSTSYTINAEEIIAFAEQFDPLPIHTCRIAGQESQFEGLIASGIHILALWRKLEFETSRDINVVCGLGVDNLRFVRPLRADDSIRCESQVASKRLSAADKSCGIVRFKHKVLNQHNQLVISHSNRVLVRCA